MALSAGKKPSKFSFAKSIKDTVNPAGKTDESAKAVGQGSAEEKISPEINTNTVTPQTDATPVKPEEVANDTNVETTKSDEIQNTAAPAQDEAPVANEDDPVEVQPAETKLEEETETVAATTNSSEAKPMKEGRAVRKNKGGRKSIGEVKKINVAIPVELLDDITSAATLLHKGNINLYIRTLIKKDLKENKETYEKLKELKKIAEL